MATMRLVPSAYTLSSTQYLTITSADNMYTNTDNTSTYATIQHTRANTTAYYLYIHGFNFGDIPSNATVSSFSIKIRARESGLSTNSSYRMSLYNNTTSISSTTVSSSLSTTTTLFTFPNGSMTWSTLNGYGNNFRIRVPLRRNSSNTAGYVYVYGAEIEVTYTVPEGTITSTLSGSGTIDPSGAYTDTVGEEYELIITPTNPNDEVTAKKDGVDITSELEHIVVSGGSYSPTFTAESFTTEINGSGGAFYTGSSTQGNYFNYAVGHTAESPGSTSTSYNTYVKDGGNNTATGYAWYDFDFSDIPVHATISSVTIKCYGACESTTHDATHKANITLWSDNTQKGTEQYFTSTSNSTITISSPGTWTRDELQDAKLRFEVAYYGGRLFGITWTVNYTTPDENYYSYTCTIALGSSTIAVTIGSSATLYVKVNGTWTAYNTVYKKVSGSWVLQNDLTQIFDSGVNYKIN